MGIMVSISCTTYNHENYVAQALDSFLAQKTDFEFEILVHDDASTDGTVPIVREYEEKYPTLIKPIYQSENQYSKGVKIWPLNDARAQGKYLALCEGDDYWTDSTKLQRQVDLMEAHPGASLSVHSALKVRPDRSPIGEMSAASSDRSIGLDELLENRKEFATASMLYPARFTSQLPDYFYHAPVGDWPLALFLASMGEVRYINRPMSAYRINAVNSWTLKIRDDLPMRVDYNRRMAEMFRAFDDATDLAHTEAVQKLVDWHDFTLAQLEGDYARVKDPRYSHFYGDLSWRYRFMITLRHRAPHLASALDKARDWPSQLHSDSRP